MKPVKIALIGVGNRGLYVYGEYAKRHPEMLCIAAAAEPDSTKRKIIQSDHHIPDNMIFDDWSKLFNNFPNVDAVVIATQDKMHLGPILAAIEQNVNILCEKPIVTTERECSLLEQHSHGFTKIFLVTYVLRYSAFFMRIKELIDTYEIGNLIGIDLKENVGHIHISHSYVRGLWRRKDESSPMILAKSCHDMDILLWLSGAPCLSLNSYGDLYHFKAANAPEGAPLRCLEGCPHGETCPYNVEKIYLTENNEWPVNAITTDLSIAGRIKALEVGPWGRCVYHCDNDVVDHQILSASFANGVVATFTMSGFTMDTHRTIKLFGTDGEIEGDLEKGIINIKKFSTRENCLINVAAQEGGHAGGDVNLIRDFIRMVREGDMQNTMSIAFQSHFMAFAAERSRMHGGETVNMEASKKSM